MIELLKKTMFAGVGLAVVTKEKVLESLEELLGIGADLHQLPISFCTKDRIRLALWKIRDRL